MEQTLKKVPICITKSTLLLDRVDFLGIKHHWLHILIYRLFCDIFFLRDSFPWGHGDIPHLRSVFTFPFGIFFCLNCRPLILIRSGFVRFSFLQVLPRYRLLYRPHHVRLRSVTSCPHGSVGLYTLGWTDSYKHFQRETWASRVSPLLQGVASLPSVNGRSLRHVLVRQISALVWWHVPTRKTTHLLVFSR